MTDPAKFTTGSFCSGICAPEVAWHALGWTPLWFSEVDPFASAVESYRFPGVPNLGDMTAIDPAALPDASVWVAGTPCQAFSVAGLRRSLRDDRGNLTLHFVKLIHARNPLVVVWENVPGVLSTSDNAFGCFLAGLVGEGEPLVCGDGSWPDAGMVAGPVRSAAWRILDAQYFGLAQRRRRVFVISFRAGDGINSGAVLFEPESVRRDSPPRREAGARTANSLTRSLGTGADDNKAQANWLIPSVPHHCNEVSRALTACHTATGRLDPNEMEFVAYGIHSDALDRSGEGASGTAGERAGLGISEDLSPCINAKRPNAVAAPIAFQERGREGGRSVETQEDLAYSLTAPNGGGRRHELNIAASMAVRRLTLRECERLQGFEDDWTLIPYRGKPAADGNRYRALGNSMAVPVLRWIGERIEKVLAAHAERTEVQP